MWWGYVREFYMQWYQQVSKCLNYIFLILVESTRSYGFEFSLTLHIRTKLCLTPQTDSSVMSKSWEGVWCRSKRRSQNLSSIAGELSRVNDSSLVYQLSKPQTPPYRCYIAIIVRYRFSSHTPRSQLLQVLPYILTARVWCTSFFCKFISFFTVYSSLGVSHKNVRKFSFLNWIAQIVTSLRLKIFV